MNAKALDLGWLCEYIINHTVNFEDGWVRARPFLRPGCWRFNNGDTVLVHREGKKGYAGSSAVAVYRAQADISQSSPRKWQ